MDERSVLDEALHALLEENLDFETRTIDLGPNGRHEIEMEGFIWHVLDKAGFPENFDTGFIDPAKLGPTLRMLALDWLYARYLRNANRAH